MTTIPVGFYNCREGRPGAVLQRELDAQLETRLFLGLAECVGYRLAKRRGFVLVRDTTTRSRANIAAYVSDKLINGAPHWHDLKKTWLNQVNNRQHNPRSSPVIPLTIGGQRVRGIVAHLPPIQPHRPDHQAQRAAQAEHLDVLMRVTARGKSPWFILADWNMEPERAAFLIGGQAHGTRIDALVEKGLDVTGVAYPERVAGVPMKTDHGHAYQATIRPTVTKEKP